MRTGTTIKKLTTALLGLGVAAAVLTAPVPVADVPTVQAADQRQGVDDRRQTGQQRRQPGSTQDRSQDTEGRNIDPITGEQVKNTSVIEYVNSVYVWVTFIGGLLAVISLIYAGYSYMGSYGDPDKISNAKDIVEKTLIGLSLLILAALILNTINPRTVSNPCTPGEPGCGDIDFTKPGGGVPND